MNRRIPAITVAISAFGALNASAAFASQRVAAPTGTPGAACTTSDPCDLASAITGAHSGDDVLIEADPYRATSRDSTT